MLISVIIPVYNKEKYIDVCIDSVVKQSYKNLEIIIINDGSTDDSGTLIKNWLLKDERIKYYEQENKGVAETRNRGLKYATGDYIFFLDADDCLVEDALYNFFVSNQQIEADIIIGNYYEKHNNEVYKKSSYRKKLFEVKELSRIETIIDMFIDNGRAMAMAGNKLYKTDFINDISVRFQQGVISEDRLFNLMCYVNNPSILLIDDYTYIYNILEGSRSRNIKPSYYEENLALFFSFYEYLEKRSKLNKYQSLIQLNLMFDLYKIIIYTFEMSHNPIRDTNARINKLRQNKLILNTVKSALQNRKLKFRKGLKFFNHILIVNLLFLYAPNFIVGYKYVISKLRKSK